MIKKEIIKTLKQSNIDLKKVWVLCGAAMVLHEVKEHTTDIDLGCSSNYFKTLAKTSKKIKVWSDGMRSIEYSATIELFEEWNINKIVIINGIQVSSIPDILSQKEALNRSKDKQDIKILQNKISKDNEE